MKAFHLTEEEITAAPIDELRTAYRELLADNQALRTLISDRTAAAIEDLRERGLKFNGNLPYGLEADDRTKKVKPSRYETRLIAEVVRLHKAGMSLRAIARTLVDRHFVNRAGGVVDAKQVSRILDTAGVERERKNPED